MSSQLTAAQKAAIENKRLDALDRKRMKANQRLEKESLKSSIDKKRGGTSKRPAATSEIMLINDNAENLEEYGEKYIDTGAGFLLSANQIKYKPREAAPEEIMDTDLCDNCELPFENSFLRKHYSALVCDECKDDEKYPLMTLSEVKTEYVLNDNMLKRDPPLKFILKKNPHNPSWGEMKLFLLPQVWVH
ncbi:unnamed protein product [Oikopleura dioica]|uniref:XPA C-terminal domain-containing protein n=1 Tax=Oikopleura dioica TaxID=34765 RepID=E4XAX8_OIKDI|nr:unnamed protein product [Oikopleura dioica]